jgi:hypothetical protein
VVRSRHSRRCAKTNFRLYHRILSDTFPRHSTNIMPMETLNPTTCERRICEYPESACSHLPCNHNRSFPCLPQAVRRRIYSEVGLYRERSIYFSRPQDPPSPPLLAPFKAVHNVVPPFQTRTEILYNLLFTCRTI